MKEIKLETSSLEELLEVMLEFAKGFEDSGEYKSREGWVYFAAIGTVANWLKNLPVPTDSVYGFVCVGHRSKLSLNIAGTEFKIFDAYLDTFKWQKGDYPTQVEIYVDRNIRLPAMRALQTIAKATGV
ncbi:hypothetical protein EXS57_03035 [Candidatus Kaiserbacteria bacterium]|nr:hypothetical protein [Candidatus Kaiserbacteria bacterium]